jgi:formate dehydrogenase accessory protein FdhE
MKFTLEKAVQRIEAMAKNSTGTRELLEFYHKVLMTQRDIYRSLEATGKESLAGDPGRDFDRIRPGLRAVMEVARSHGPEYLADGARGLLEAAPLELEDMVLDYWQQPSDIQFFAKAAIQPYALVMAERGIKPVGRVRSGAENRCRVCFGKPQLTFLEAHEQEGSLRSMQCATCLSSWTFRRVVCANCLEEDPRKLGYFSSQELAHVRVETCETCKYYIKGIDVSVLGLAVPLVDEVAAAPLDIWAREQGYTKVELNLVGV